MTCTCACHAIEENHNQEDCYCMRKTKEVKCVDCDFKALDQCEMEEHWYFKHGAGSYHGEVTVVSEGKEIFKVDENKNVVDIDKNWRGGLKV